MGDGEGDVQPVGAGGVADDHRRDVDGRHGAERLPQEVRALPADAAGHGRASRPLRRVDVPHRSVPPQPAARAGKRGVDDDLRERTRAPERVHDLDHRVYLEVEQHEEARRRHDQESHGVHGRELEALGVGAHDAPPGRGRGHLPRGVARVESAVHGPLLPLAVRRGVHLESRTRRRRARSHRPPPVAGDARALVAVAVLDALGHVPPARRVELPPFHHRLADAAVVPARHVARQPRDEHAERPDEHRANVVLRPVPLVDAHHDLVGVAGGLDTADQVEDLRALLHRDEDARDGHLVGTPLACLVALGYRRVGVQPNVEVPRAARLVPRLAVRRLLVPRDEAPLAGAPVHEPRRGLVVLDAQVVRRAPLEVSVVRLPVVPPGELGELQPLELRLGDQGAAVVAVVVELVARPYHLVDRVVPRPRVAGALGAVREVE
mmetsp:Transcript_5623/g.12727  ORF Transcript_5623/g.12727 Transcript_5623/m.12727 type:complete len:436 (+) Transcript_5623:914-2221(+)